MDCNTIIDLTCNERENRDGSSLGVNSHEDEAAKQAIMAFAKSRRQSGSSTESSKRVRLDADSSSYSDQTMQNGHAQQPPMQQKQIPIEPQAPMNDTLFMLRLEREERQRQRQRQHSLQAAPTQPASGQEMAPPTSNDLGAQQQQQQQQQLHQRGFMQQGLKQQQHGPQQHRRKRSAAEQPTETSGSFGNTTASILTFNIWFEPDAMEERMEGLGKLIERLEWPDIILLQEVTISALQLFKDTSWIKRYTLIPLPEPLGNYFTLTLARSDTVRIGTRERVPFSNSCQGRDLTIVRAYVKGHPLTFGNTHLESPIPISKFAAEREQQLQDSLKTLQSRSQGYDIVFGGDMNWNEANNEPQQVLQEAKFVDLWPALQPGQPGLTYDARKNPMLTHSFPGRRIDRFFARLGARWQGDSIELVGTEPIPGKTVSREINRTTKARKDVPMLISDHFGILLKLKAHVPAGRKLGSQDAAA